MGKVTKKKPKKYEDSEYYKDNMDPDAVEFFRELNDVVHSECRGVVTIAEESTAWPGVTKDTSSGGLGFTFKFEGTCSGTAQVWHLNVTSNPDGTDTPLAAYAMLARMSRPTMAIFKCSVLNTSIFII